MSLHFLLRNTIRFFGNDTKTCLDPKYVHPSADGQVVVLIQLSPESNPQGTHVGILKLRSIPTLVNGILEF